jgi:hypothetical protein
MSKPTNEPSSEPICKLNGINTSYTFEAVNGVNADASQPTVAKTSEGDKTSCTFEAVNSVNADASQPTVAKTSEGDKTSYTFGQ